MKYSNRIPNMEEKSLLFSELEALKKEGLPYYDLTNANPTATELGWDVDILKACLSSSISSHFKPDPQGELSARNAIAKYYKSKAISVFPDSIVLYTGTSEALGQLMKLLCDPGDNIISLEPGYCLLDSLCQLEGVDLKKVKLKYVQDEWNFDSNEIMKRIDSKTRAILVVNPNNPTGSFIDENQKRQLFELADQYKICLISDEVFLDYPFPHNESKAKSFLKTFETNLEIKNFVNIPAVFVLSGISKILGLPQFKLSWLVFMTSLWDKSAVREKLEYISDAYLSVNSIIQKGLPSLLDEKEFIQEKIRHRIQQNFKILQSSLSGHDKLKLMVPEGGWHCVLLLGNIDDEAFSFELLKKEKCLAHPGFLFDMEQNALVVSLIALPLEMQIFTGKLLSFLEKF